MQKSQVGMIGLAVMGANLARNLERNGFSCAVYNRSYEVTEKFIKANEGKAFLPAKTLEEFVQSIEAPRKIFMMIQAGTATDAVIRLLIPLLDKGDILIDGGNAYFKDTVAREALCTEAGINFLGVGISGGEEGALNGASIMPGGPRTAWEKVAPILEKIAAWADAPCTSYIGPGGAGHFVKMVHNGIEYGDMQLIAEAYDLLKRKGGYTPPELGELFGEWNEGVLQSYLIEITSKIFKRSDDQGEGYLVDKIVDRAGQKGTGKWTTQTALDLGIAIPTISSSVDARALSALKPERLAAAEHFERPEVALVADKDAFARDVHDALYCAKIMSYAQGMALLEAGSREWNWDLKLGEIAALWKGGCIIRARFLDEIRKAYVENPSLANLILAPSMKQQVFSRIGALRRIVATAVEAGIPVPSFSSSLSYFDSYTTASLPQNLTQAQRDFFGAHTFMRTDREGAFHAQWE